MKVPVRRGRRGKGRSTKRKKRTNLKRVLERSQAVGALQGNRRMRGGTHIESSEKKGRKKKVSGKRGERGSVLRRIQARGGSNGREWMKPRQTKRVDESV